MKSISTLLMALCCLVCAQFSSAQVFIPDQLERDWLNAEIPGLVDANGIMDTLHPMIAQFDSASFHFNEGSTDLIHFVGVSYLDSLVSMWLSAHNANSMIMEPMPDALRSLSITGDIVSIQLLGLPRKMDDIWASGFDGSLSIAQLPDSLGTLSCSGISNVTLNGGDYIERFYMYMSLGPSTLSLPELRLHQISIDDGDFTHLDLSATTVDTVLLAVVTSDLPIAWPDSVVHISINDYSSGIFIGYFPPTLRSLVAYGLPQQCIPPLPNGLAWITLTMDGPPFCIPNWPDSLTQWLDWPFGSPASATYCSVLNSSCPGSNPGITGTVFIDLDEDGELDAGESGLPHTSVVLQPNDISVGCQPDGSWEVGVMPGNYTTIAGTSYPYLQSITPTQHAADVPDVGDIDVGNDFAITLVPDIQDIRVHIHALPARPGFDNQVHLRCENYGTMPVDAELTLAFDADQTWLGSSVAPASSSSNTATWNFPAMPIGAVQHIVVDLTTATTVALGTDIAHTLTANPIGTDETPQNNVDTFTDSVVGSYDPNDKLLSPAVLTPTGVQMGETPIEYTIRFQNTGTYLAERVVILDTLSQDLQWESMRFIASSHDQHWYIVDGVLHVIHNDIMLPDSNASEPESHGFFQFSMLPKTDLGNGSTIENIAHIVFDFNAPIITPPAVFMVDIGAGVTDASKSGDVNVIPNPAQERVQVHAGNTGMLHYRIIDVLGAQVQAGVTFPGDWLVVENLPPGAYLMVLDQDDSRTIRRIIKE
jgi:uncharacterized repeat protein (TIGR01451 family)